MNINQYSWDLEIISSQSIAFFSQDFRPSFSRDMFEVVVVIVVVFVVVVVVVVAVVFVVTV